MGLGLIKWAGPLNWAALYFIIVLKWMSFFKEMSNYYFSKKI